MATIKIKFRASTVKQKEGTLFFQVIHNRMVRQINAGLKLYPGEWDKNKSEVRLQPGMNEDREAYLLALQGQLEKDKNRLENIIVRLGCINKNFTAEQVVNTFLKSKSESLASFTDNLIIQLRGVRKERTAETYTTVRNSFIRFCGDDEILLDDIDSTMMIEYETYLKKKGNMLQHHLFLYEKSTGHLQPRRRKGTDGPEKSLQVCLYRYRQNPQTGSVTECHPQDPGSGSDPTTRSRPGPGYLHVFVLYPRHVVHRHGLSQEKGSPDGHIVIPTAENPSSTEYQMGETYAENRRQIRHEKNTVYAPPDQKYRHLRKDSVSERRPSYQPQTEKDRATAEFADTSDSLCGPARMGQHSKEQKHIAGHHQRSDGAQFGKNHANLSCLIGHLRGRQSQYAYIEIPTDRIICCQAAFSFHRLFLPVSNGKDKR